MAPFVGDYWSDRHGGRVVGVKRRRVGRVGNDIVGNIEFIRVRLIRIVRVIGRVRERRVLTRPLRPGTRRG